MLEFFIQDDPIKKREAVEGAAPAINTRVQFWDGVEVLLLSERAINSEIRAGT